MVLSIEALQATSELEDVKDALRQAQNEIKEYQKKLMGFDKMRRDLGQKTKEVERLNSIVEKKEKKMASISRLAWGAQVVMQHMNKPDDERICHLSAEVERLCLELADKDQVIQDFKLKNAIDSLDSIAEHVGTELPSRTLRARTAARLQTSRAAIGMPDEEPCAAFLSAAEIAEPEGSARSEYAGCIAADINETGGFMLHSREWQALFMRKQREIDGFRKAWMEEVEELGGFIEHLHDEGHRKVSFDDFMLMIKTISGTSVFTDENGEEQAMVDALEAAVDYVLTIGTAPPLPEEIRQLHEEIERLQASIKILEEQKQSVEDAWQAEKEASAEDKGLEKGASEVWASMAVLDFGIKVRISPLQLRKVGAIIRNMQDAGYGNEQINYICRALFLSQCEEDMRTAWKVFDIDQSGYLDGEEFKKALPLLGEDVDPEQVETLFQEVDTDGSGKIEFPEFCVMVKAMNPSS